MSDTPPALVLGEAAGALGMTTVGSTVACSAEVHSGQRLPLDMYFLVDSSGSMAEQVQGGSKWQVVSASLDAFLSRPENADIGTGIGYFPAKSHGTCVAGQSGCVCIPVLDLCFTDLGGSCDVNDYAAPSVPLSLPANPRAVIADIANHSPSGGTPTQPALQGAMGYVSAWIQAHPERRGVVVLATDGDPSGCTSNAPADAADVAARGLSGSPPVKTFVIGVGSSLTSLNLIAQAGGTGQAFLVDTGSDVGEAFDSALSAIRGQATPCDFAIPAQTALGTVDPRLVNVLYTPQGGAQSIVPMTRDGSAASCSASTGGWYYENPAAPRSIRLCDATCQAAGAGQVELAFGCASVIVK